MRKKLRLTLLLAVLLLTIGVFWASYFRYTDVYLSFFQSEAAEPCYHPPCHSNTPIPHPTASNTPVPSHTPLAAFACTPPSQSAAINQDASFSITNGSGGPYKWTATGGTPASGTTTSFKTKYTTAGTKTVTVTEPFHSASCTVTVTGPVTPPPTPQISVDKSGSPTTLPSGGGAVTYRYLVTNPGTLALSAITVSDDKCSSVRFIDGDTNNNQKLEAGETWLYSCSMTITATTTNTGTATGRSGTATVQATDRETVTVSTPTVFRDINISKSALPSSLSAGGGTVTYRYVVTNPGTVPLSNISTSDNTCSPVSYISGDTNQNSQLDLNEAWTYQCVRNVSTTTTNTAIAQGAHQGVTVSKNAQATVTIQSTTPVYSISIEKLGEDVSKNSGLQNRVDASPNDILRFTLRIRSDANARLTNIIIRDLLPNELVYEPGTAKVNGSTYPDGITGNGISIGALDPNDRIDVTFHARVRGPEAFQNGTTALANGGYVRADNVSERESKIPVYISKNVLVPIGPIKTGVDGATVTLIASLFLTFGYHVVRRGLASVPSLVPSSRTMTVVVVIMLLLAGSIGVSSLLENSQISYIEIRASGLHKTDSYYSLIEKAR